MNVYVAEFFSGDYIPYHCTNGVVANSLEEALAFILDRYPESRLRGIRVTQEDVVIINPDHRSVFNTKDEKAE